MLLFWKTKISFLYDKKNADKSVVWFKLVTYGFSMVSKKQCNQLVIFDVGPFSTYKWHIKSKFEEIQSIFTWLISDNAYLSYLPYRRSIQLEWSIFEIFFYLLLVYNHYHIYTLKSKHMYSLLLAIHGYPFFRCHCTCMKSLILLIFLKR